MFQIPQSTAFTVVFKAYLSSDHVTEATSKTIAITISKAGGAFGNLNAGATNATEISSGWYKVALDTTDTGSLGVIAIRGTAATIDDYGDRFFVVSATTGGLTNLDAAITTRMATYTQPTGFLSATFPSGTVANTTNITAGTITTATNLTTNNDKTGYALTSGERTSIATSIWTDTTGTDFTTALSVGKSLMNGVTLGTGLTVNDITTKTGYSLTGTQTFNNTGTWTGNLSGSVGSVTGAVGSVTGAVGSVAAGVTVTTNNDKTGYTASTVSDKTGYALTSGERNSIADAMLDRDMSTGADSGSTTVRTVRQALRFLRNKFAIVAGTLTVYKEDDTTSSWTSTITTAAGNPVSSSDPAG